MRILTPKDLRLQLKQKEILPVYLLLGSETFQRNLAAQAISDIAMRDSNLRSFNESEFSLNRRDIREAIAAAEQLPMMDNLRVVRVIDVVVSTNRMTCNLKEGFDELLRSYLSNPSPSTVLIIVADELDKRLKIAKTLITGSMTVEFQRLSGQEMFNWAKEWLRDLEVRADEKALRHLVALVGVDLGKLKLELEKLAVAAYPEKIITYELVDALVPASRDLSNFKLTDHLLSNRKTLALQVLKEILDDGAEPLMLLGLIGGNFHRLLLAKEMMNEGVHERDVRKVLRSSYDMHETLLGIARRTDRNRLARILERIAETDVAIKSSRATPRLQIEMLVCELAGMH